MGRRGKAWASKVLAAAFALVAASLGVARPKEARADDTSTLAEVDLQRLARGDTLAFEKTLESDGHRYVGGVTYTLVEASEAQMARLFEDVTSYAQVLPRTLSARRVGPWSATAPSAPGQVFVELHQGNAVVAIHYTLELVPGPERNTIRFWVDRHRPHEIDDAWGFFRYELVGPPLRPAGTPTVLLTYGILVDLGPGLVRELFEDRVRAALLNVPQRVRSYAARSVQPATPLATR